MRKMDACSGCLKICRGASMARPDKTNSEYSDRLLAVLQGAAQIPGDELSFADALRFAL